MPTLHQLVAGFRRGDAISNEALLIRDLCAAHGLASDIRCPRQSAFSDDRALTRDVESLPGEIRPDDVALLHLSIGSRCNRIFPSLPCRKVILYHNVTPPRFFERLNPATAQILADGLAQVAELKDAADSVWADSAFNAGELRAMGYRDPKVFPLLVDESFGTGTVHAGLRRTLSDPPLANLLFVGRLAPNKRHDILLQVFSAFQRYVNPASRLVVAGGSGGAEAYKALLLGSVYTLVAKNVLFTDFVDDPKLRACYATASAFVCTSDHEGFCAPLLEAMAWHVPVFARAAGAVPETLDGAGVLFAPDAPPETMAETIGRVLGDPALRAEVVRKQDERLARFRSRDAWAELRGMIGA
jgi:glycosyltransferase involved in cell wall biosynthesis